jgi:pimeloyl-ACP methyl ester carboxylesterase
MLEKEIKIWNFLINYKEFFNNKDSQNILILHGWQGSSDSWVEVGKKLKNANYNVIIPDIPCASKNTDCKKIFSLEEYAILIEKFLEKLKLNNIILWWHSNWWAISIKISNREKINILRLVLNNSAWIRLDKKRSLKRKIFSILIKPFKNFKKIKLLKKLRILFYKAIWSHDYLNAEKNPKLKETYLNMISSDLKNEIKNIKHNTLLIWWKNDSYTPISDAYFMRNNIKNSKLVILDGEKHWIHLQNPERLVSTFLKEI